MKKQIKKDKDTDKIDWSAIEEHWANDYNEVYAPKEQADISMSWQNMKKILKYNYRHNYRLWILIWMLIIGAAVVDIFESSSMIDFLTITLGICMV